MIRRNFLSTFPVFLISNRVIAQGRMVPKKKTYVLVHGAWHGGWCWKYVKSKLISLGHTVYTPSLTGLGDRVHLSNKNINLSTHVQDIINLIHYENLDNIILVGHSYAGHVISLVADRISNKISNLVYLDAVLPTNGKAFLPSDVGEERMKNAKKGYLMEVPNIESFLGVPKKHKKYDWLKDNLVPHPLPTLTEKVVYIDNGIEKIPKIYVRCKRNPRIKNGKNDPVIELIENDDTWSYLTIDTGHDLMITAPDETAMILSQVH